MNALRAVTPIFALAIMLPAPMAQARVINAAMCNGGTTQITLPTGTGGPMPADDHECCRKGCHAGSDRRKKANQLTDSCC
jgi:hypothetical protein